MLGSRIKDARKKAGFTQQSLAEALGVSIRTVTFWEANERTPSLELLKKIGKLLNVSPDYLLNEEENKPSIPDDDDIKFALFGVDPRHITDEQFEEVKRFAQFVREQKQKGKIK